MRFWILLGWDALIALVVLYFFFAGLTDGSISSFNIKLWLIILLALAGVVGGGFLLRSVGRSRTAECVLLILAVPGVLFVLFFLFLLIAHPRWN